MIPPKVGHLPLDPTKTAVLCCPQSRPDTNLKEEPKTPGKPTRPTGSRAPSLTPRRWMVHRLNTGRPPVIETLPNTPPNGGTCEPGIDLAGKQGRPHFVRPRALRPLRDSTVVYLDDGSGFGVPSLYRSGAPCDSTAVTIDGGSGFAFPAHRTVERHW